jgi:hypothetical protein
LLLLGPGLLLLLSILHLVLCLMLEPLLLMLHS